ncbi:molybdenum-pterin binding domain-containing protein [Desulfotomaculum arcticum]|uniref:Molybdenum-pterin binding domain-containing protein n=1 Tax=Desulfotruncus arcticus DSM 17038 TaxID=1121424 RepID=A0A1I2V3E7_9FIRM|nr:TOBE domain-containing protein [Desulfotruncus arcticus]SFG83965.1 molybdenum-pterin binding domain-containing protein [Desulfotomaculum arcticum] [Desulfotruncus arcticus DSM 17038]
MELSARNQLKARIKSINKGDTIAEVILDIGGQEMCSTITTGSVNKLGLNVGDDVTTLIKASSVMIMK